MTRVAIEVDTIGKTTEAVGMPRQNDDQKDRIRQLIERLGIRYRLNENFAYYGRPIPVSFFLPQLNIAIQHLSATGNDETALVFLEKEACYAELKFKRIKRFHKRLWCFGLVTSDIEQALLCKYITPLIKHANHLCLEEGAFEQYLKTLVGWTPESPSATARLVLGGKTVFVPAKVDSHRSFVEAISKIRRTLTGEAPSWDTPKFVWFVGLMYYLLGWTVGDAGKTFTSERLLSARLSVELTRVHPENIPLGEFVGECVKALGLPWIRRPDKRPTATDPNGAYRWQSLHSPVFGWFHTSCLGIEWTERTTRTAVKMDWLLGVPHEFQIWFLRGLADSDGSVHFRDRSVEIVTEPNGALIVSLFKSLGIHTNLTMSKGCSVIVISGRDAEKICIFNPEVMTHRRVMLRRIMGARTFQRHWPPWLEAKTRFLLKQGLGIRETFERLLDEDNVYVKYNTLKRKRAQIVGSVGDGTRCQKPLSSKKYVRRRNQ